MSATMKKIVSVLCLVIVGLFVLLLITNANHKDATETAKADAVRLEEELKIKLLPKDPLDEKNVVVEIRAGAGGDEAALFAADLFRMYAKYAEREHWKVDTMNSNENGIGGFKEIVFMINGNGAYSKLKYESGVHRVQRIPVTESGGRIHRYRYDENIRFGKMFRSRTFCRF